MKKILLILAFSIVALSSNAQIKEPAKWSEPKLSKTAPSVGETIEITFDATIDEGWYLYSSDFDPDLGPIVTTFDYTGSNGVQIVGKIKPINPKKEYDDLWGGEYTYFEPKGQFKQTVKITSENPIILVKIDYQTCQHDGSCINAKKKFTINIKTSAKQVEVVKETVKTNLKEDIKTTKEEKTETVEISKIDTKVTEVVESNTDSSNKKDFVSEKNGIAVGKDGRNYVFVNNEWFVVPVDNSAAFYKKYLTLSGKR